MRTIIIFFILFFLFCIKAVKPNTPEIIHPNVFYNHDFSFSISDDNRPNSLIKIFKKRIQRTKRAIASVLAFPLPFGVLALHRIYLSTAPHVPVVYIGSVGGVFGILPCIDFCLITLDPDINRFFNNGRIFMWIGENNVSQ